MKKLNLEYDELKNLFAKYDWESLAAFEILLKHVKNYDTFLSKGLCKSALQNQYTILLYEGYFEGCNEYPETIELSYIKESIDKLDNKEALYIKTIIEDSMKNLPEGFKEDIKEDIKEILTKIKDKLENKLNKKELEILFNKYNLIELDALYGVFNYVKEYDMTDVFEVADKVYEEKEEEAYYNYEVPVKPNNFKLSDVMNKNDKLTDKEVNFLYKLVEDAAFYLTSIRDYTYGMDFDIEEYPVESVNRLETDLYREVERRNSSNKIKTLI